MLLMPNSSEIFAPAMERFTRSRNATALRTKSKKTRNQRTWLVGCEVIDRYSSRLPACPTRRPSNDASRRHAVWDLKSWTSCAAMIFSSPGFSMNEFMPRPPSDEPSTMRSEEHTSELQSRLHLVCRLLLEKKKNSTT